MVYVYAALAIRHKKQIAKANRLDNGSQGIVSVAFAHKMGLAIRRANLVCIQHAMPARTMYGR